MTAPQWPPRLAEIAGFPPLKAAGMGIRANLEIGLIPLLFALAIIAF